MGSILPRLPGLGKIPIMAIQKHKLKKHLHRAVRDRFKAVQGALVSSFTPSVILTLRASWRVELHTPPATQALLDADVPVIFACWHGRMYSLLCSVPKDRTAVLVSPSSDGELIIKTARRLGFQHYIRGSHKRQGAQAVRGMIHALQEEGQSVLFMVDGPRGPRYRLKAGIIKLASQAGVPIIPIASAPKHMLLKMGLSWDDFHIPCFFTPMRVRFGEPYHVPDLPLDEGALEQHRQALETRMRTLTQEIDQSFGRNDCH